MAAKTSFWLLRNNAYLCKLGPEGRGRFEFLFVLNEAHRKVWQIQKFVMKIYVAFSGYAGKPEVGSLGTPPPLGHLSVNTQVPKEGCLTWT